MNVAVTHVADCADKETEKSDQDQVNVSIQTVHSNEANSCLNNQ